MSEVEGVARNDDEEIVMNKNPERVTLAHGSGGTLMRDLIEKVIAKELANPLLNSFGDSALIEENGLKIAFTTDSFVVKPPFFNGGDIGKLAICGTVNDLAVSGATPLYLSLALIIEEGFSVADLHKITKSIANEAKKANVKVITGDTKVVEKGKGDKIYINTAGIGITTYKLSNKIRAGDKIIINGPLGEHGVAVIIARENLSLHAKVKSDCASLQDIIDKVCQTGAVKWMRDPTRGGLAVTLNEAASKFLKGIEIYEEKIPKNKNVEALCNILGYDPLYIANEGKVIIFAPDNKAKAVLATLKSHPLGKKAKIIGQIMDEHPGKVILRTAIGGSRIVDMPIADQLPRIC